MDYLELRQLHEDYGYDYVWLWAVAKFANK